MARSIETVFMVNPLRSSPVGIDEGIGRILEESGVVDYVAMTDVLGAASFVPAQFGPENPGDAPDAGSWFDPGIALGVMATRHPNLGVLYGGIPALRRGPAELFRAGLTLASLTEGRALCWIGVGERYNTVPFGYDRAEGLGRIEDHFRLYKLLWEADAPFDFEGNFWKYERAFLGHERTHRPEFWALGGGPKLIELAASHADGWMTVIPAAAPSPEAYAKRVTTVREDVERAGRDPDAFGFGIQPLLMMHEDPDVIEAGLQSPVVRLLASMWGRFPHASWRDEGVDTVFPDGWDYSLHWDALSLSHAEIDSLLQRIPDEMVRRSFLIGTPSEVTEVVQAYVDAGATQVAPFDLLGSWGGSEVTLDAWTPDTVRWQLEMFRELKG
ncbi:LLM class flavin-dependent oxidoreductase [Mycolicibacterium hippocampi]|uniref:Luciferase-like domain-containing protein n=1 Tax=Mycolicibacterium hippocampi TaxID=659824 RepID=A0A7I9ZG23_9MYCO|nr:LLM class flavin-dependent oxidoreductase [Mycolicibacterium hippocampi]GFG99788.1 hypothetical protein MHIP_02720 [Mycolicibacterium hippocampi]